MVFSMKANGQFTDLARIDYTILPSVNSKFEFNRTRFIFNYPIKLGRNYAFLGLDYSNINIIYGQDPTPFEKEEIDGFQLLDLNLGYTFKINEDWRFAIRVSPGISSNLKADQLSFSDVVLSSDAVIIRNRKDEGYTRKPNRLILGLSYSGNRGFPFPLPFISYYRKFTPHFSYNVGVPRTNLQYHISEKHRLKIYAQLDGLTANIQNGILIGEEKAERYNMSLILLGLQYEFHFWDNFEFFVRTSSILDRNVELRDSENQGIFTIDSSSGISFRIGLRAKVF